ncbi:alpha/beta fold hydrolase [Sorangium sp. So ce1099]|uniref:alpha/beta fold hydrolase n=1 Tax=Sorangium sp. So ce1099 TaxID=3133331 RepID=UPI003F5E430D
MIAEAHLTLRGRRFSFLDFGGAGTPILALHGHFGRARMFAPLAAALGPGHRLVALDQRGHGLSDRGGSFTREDYIEDAAELLRALGLGAAVVLGHSMGGVNAYQLAARYPELVRALIIEDIGAVVREPEVQHPVLDVSRWPVHAPTREALEAAIEAQGIPDASYFMDSAIEDADGWRLLFDYADMMASQEALLGDFWNDWLASSCPALLLHGQESPLLSASMARTMAERRPRTDWKTFHGCGHWIHDDDPAGFAEAIREFLARI